MTGPGARGLAGVALLFGLVGAVLWLRTTSPADADGEASSTFVASSFGGPRTCLPCHAQVVAEWEASMHAAAFTDPQVRAPDQADNFSRQECLPCHAPAPIFEHGIAEGTRTLARVERRADGVDCLSCHALPGGGVAAGRAGLDAPCRPVYRPELSQHVQCASCHNQHNTHDEWLVSPAAARGEDCMTCHMQRVTRTDSEAGAPRAGRSHRFLGGRDREFALAGLELEHAFDASARTLTVRLTNTFAGHNLPTDSRNRALDLVVTLLDARGRALAPGEQQPAQEREPGCEAGTARLRFRNPYRSAGKPSSQLPAGETATLSVEVPENAVRARVELLYRLQPFVTDAEAHWSLTEDVALR
ncbi:MAG: multiheme c-type cytochrome [Planctomycetota bacterium]|jgi:hypothetical protein